MGRYDKNASRTLTALIHHEEDSARRIRSYASRLLSSRDLDPSLLEFVICTLPPSAQRKLYDKISKTAEKRNSKEHVDFSAEDMAKHLISLTETRNSQITKAGLARELSKGLGAGIPADVKPPLEVQRLADMLSLRQSHVDLIMFLYDQATFTPLDDFTWQLKLRELLSLIADATGLGYAELIDATKSNGRLRVTGLIAKAAPASSPPITLHDDAILLIGGIASGRLTEKFFEKDTEPTLNIKCTYVPTVSKDVISTLLTKPGAANILLYGVPGTGKTAFARSIAAASGHAVYQVKHPEDSEEEDKGLKNRRVALIAATNSVAPDNSVLIVDEADTFLNTMFSLVSSRKESPDKGWLNTFLDKSKHKIIWITNESRLIEESTMRRFSYSLHFPRPNSRTRYQLWKDLIMGHPMREHIKDETIRRLSSRYPVTTGGIASALGTLERVASVEDQSADTLLTDLVAKHAKAIGVQSGNMMQPIPAAYDAGILNADMDLERVVSSVTKASESAPANCWGDGYGLNLLLWGAPGTGKTAFAQHIAETTGRELLVKRASDILSPFVGMTERYIAEAFEEASEAGSILLIDEADSLLVDRRYAKASWETTQTNELLCQMESFPGMLICCTNLLDKLDPAVLRRFAWKVEFRELSLPARRIICARYFPGITGWDNTGELSSLRGLTPGDVKAVWQRSRTIGEAYTTAHEVIAALAEELRYKARKTGGIGFLS